MGFHLSDAFGAVGAGAGALFGGAAGAQVGGAIGSGIGGAAAQDRANDDAFAKQKWLVDYNSPINQMKRLKEAGLNPALMYPGGGGAQASAAQPKVEPVNYAAGVTLGLQAMVDYALMDKRMQLLDAQRIKTLQDTVTSQSVAALNAYKLDTFMPRQVDQFMQSISESKSREAKVNFDRLRGESMLPGELQYQQADIKLKDEMVEKVKAEKLGQLLENERKEIVNSNLDARLKQELVNLQEQVANWVTERKLRGELITKAEIENRVAKEFEGLAKAGITKDSGVLSTIMGKFAEKLHTIQTNNGAGGSW